MKTLRITIIFCFTLAASFLTERRLPAALPIDLEVATEAGVAISAPQEWARVLGRLDLGTVRLRGARGGERPEIKEVNLGQTPRYRVLAILTAGNELRLPTRRFRVTDRKGMQKYFEQLPAQTAYHAEDRGKFGLTEPQFKAVYAELSQPLGFSTVGKTTDSILNLIEKKLSTPVQRTDVASLRNSKPLTTELSKLSAGTSLAFALRCEGLMLVPEQLPGQPLQLSIVAYDSKSESWPIGWKPAVSSRRSAPQLYEKRNIEINGFTLSQALAALQPALQVPVLLDHWILEKREIDPAQIQVKLPKKRTFLKSALGSLLSQARLAEELRVDEQDQPFLWVTRFGKDSPTAIK